jgi:hypothetical protein
MPGLSFLRKRRKTKSDPDATSVLPTEMAKEIVYERIKTNFCSTLPEKKDIGFLMYQRFSPDPNAIHLWSTSQTHKD